MSKLLGKIPIAIGITINQKMFFTVVEIAKN